MRANNRDPLVEAMRDAGCGRATIADFIQLGRANDRKGQFQVLEQHRQALLTQVHECQRKIDTLDCLVYRMKKATELPCPCPRPGFTKRVKE